jgi:peptide/nickel transport system substrate-binding protein
MFLFPAYEPLIHQEPDGTFSPGLATEWSYVDGSQTEFELTLREGALFSDGTTPVDAAAVKANLDRVLDGVTGPQTGELSSTLQSVSVVDDLTVHLTLSSPNPALERILSQLMGMIVNPTALEDPTALAGTPAGAGPYVLDTGKTIVNDTYVYTKNENFYDPDAYPYPTVTVKVYGEQNAMLTALQSGVAQLGYGAPDTLDVAKGSGLGVAEQPTNVFYMTLSDRDGTLAPPLADVRVRQALNFAVDRDAILESVFRGQGVSTDQIFAPGTDAYDPALDDYYAYDPDRARELLAEAGYPDGFTFSTALVQVGRDSDYAQALAAYFAEVGVTMEIAPISGGTSDPSVLRQYPTYFGAYGGQGGFGDATNLLLTPGSVFNPFGTESEQFETLWRDATNAATPEEREAGYQALSAAVTEEAWFLPTTALNAIAYYKTDVFDDIQFTPGVTVPLFSTLAQ